MDGFVKAFIKASLTWLSLGVALGVAMAAYPLWIIYRPAHLHMLVLGFVTMMIFGVAYHVIPRFSGNPLHGRRFAAWHWWASNLGLLLMTVGFMVRPHVGERATSVIAVGGVLAALGAWLFAYLIWRTIDGPVALRRAAAQAAERARSRSAATHLPLAEEPPVPRAAEPMARLGSPRVTVRQIRVLIDEHLGALLALVQEHHRVRRRVRPCRRSV